MAAERSQAPARHLTALASAHSRLSSLWPAAADSTLPAPQIYDVRRFCAAHAETKRFAHFWQAWLVEQPCE
jgi:hypothetical protein